MLPVSPWTMIFSPADSRRPGCPFDPVCPFFGIALLKLIIKLNINSLNCLNPLSSETLSESPKCRPCVKTISMSAWRAGQDVSQSKLYSHRSGKRQYKTQKLAKAETVRAFASSFLSSFRRADLGNEKKMYQHSEWRFLKWHVQRRAFQFARARQ